MNPVAIFRFSPGEGPGYFASFLDQHAVPWTLIRLDLGEPVPTALDQYAGFAFMGGPMSANDALTWNDPIRRLIGEAIGLGYPCVGHCLGGQLMSRALGGIVSINPVKEIGWNRVYAEDSACAVEWLGEEFVRAHTLTTFQWHGENFSMPPGAKRILHGDACTNQAYVIGASLAMQFHVEMTGPMIEKWCEDWEAEGADPAPESVQTPEEIRALMAANLVRLKLLADNLYTRWIRDLPA